MLGYVSLRTGVVLLVLLNCTLLQAQQVYKWVDESGQTHYTQTPPPDLEPQSTEVIRFGKTGSVDRQCCSEVRQFALDVAQHMRNGRTVLEIQNIFPPHNYPQISEVSNFVAGRSPDQVSPAAISGQAFNACMNRIFQACRVDSEALDDVESAVPEGSSSGSGFGISKGVYLTNHHVVNKCSSITVGPKNMKARLLASDAELDLALLKVNARQTNYPRIRGGSVALGEAVVVAGFPLGQILGSINVTTGTVSADAGIGGEHRVFQFTAPVQPGSSGGPVLDQSGRLLGVVVARINDNYTLRASGAVPQNVNFAIKPGIIRSFLKQNNIKYSGGSSAVNLSTQEITADAKQYTSRIICKR